MSTSSKMTISQGIRRIKELKNEITLFQKRMSSGVSYPSKEKPAFPFGESYELFKSAQKELVELHGRLAATNAQTNVVYDGRTMRLSEATKFLAEMKSQISFLETLPCKDHESVDVDTIEYDESDFTRRIKVTKTWHCDFPEKKRADEVARIKKNFATLNDAVETMNHRTLLEA